MSNGVAVKEGRTLRRKFALVLGCQSPSVPVNNAMAQNKQVGPVLHTAGVRRTANGTMVAAESATSSGVSERKAGTCPRPVTATLVPDASVSGGWGFRSVCVHAPGGPAAAGSAGAANTDDEPSTPGDPEKGGTSVVDTSVAVAMPLTNRGRRGRSQRTVKGNKDRVWSIQTPITWKVPNMDNRPYPIADRYVLQNITSSTSGYSYYSYYFLVSSIGNASTLAALFDQYRIVEIEWATIPHSSNGSDTSTTNMGRLTTVVDYDDAGALGSEQQALDYQNAITSSGGDGQYRRFRPHAATAAYSGTFTAYMNVQSPWCDAASLNVQHYGIKMVWSPTDSTYDLDIIIVLHTQWKNVR